MSSRSEGGPSLRLILGDKDKLNISEAPEFYRKVDGSFKIGDEFSFNHGEVLGLIAQIAKLEGFNSSDLEIEGEVHSTDGQLILLDIQVRTSRALAEGWGKIIYCYMASGSGTFGFSCGHSISRAHAEIEEPNEFRAGGCVADYDGIKWIINPNHMALTVQGTVTIK